MKYLLIKTGVNTSEALVTFVSSLDEPSLFIPLAKEIINLLPEVKGVLLNHNPHDNNVVLGETTICLVGQESIQERLGELFFKISTASFFQVNPLQAEKLYQKALDLADLQGNETVLDAYCGVGTLTLHIAKKAKKAIGIECVPEAIQDAHGNALLNQISNVSFFCNTVEAALPSLDKMDVVFLNPPRKGCEKSVLDTLISTKPLKIVYISCDPETLARDLFILSEGGYQVEKVQPMDMFPQTAHVETVVKLKFNHRASESSERV